MLYYVMMMQLILQCIANSKKHSWKFETECVMLSGEKLRLKVTNGPSQWLIKLMFRVQQAQGILTEGHSQEKGKSEVFNLHNT